MTGSTPVVNITFHRSKPSEYPGYSEAHYVYYDLVRSLLLLSLLPCVVIHCCCPWYCPIFANSCSIEGERISITLVSAVEFQGKSMFEGCLLLTELEWFLVAIQISGQDNPPVIKPPPLFGQTTESSLGQAIYSRSGKKQSCLLESDGGVYHIGWVYCLLSWHWWPISLSGKCLVKILN